MDLKDTHSYELFYHNITRNYIAIDKYNGISKQVNVLEKVSG